MFCQCGCGGLAPVAKQTNSLFGWVKGCPVKYIRGHAAKDKSKPRKSWQDCFWEKVSKGESCWLWKGALTNNRYGQFGHRSAPSRYAHRVSYELHFGPPGNLFVCHHCDNPSCVRPDHLFLGTAADNTSDMMKKNRNGHGRLAGSSHGNSKLTEQQVLEIRDRSLSGQSYREIAQMYKVTKSNIAAIVNRKTWSTLK